MPSNLMTQKACVVIPARYNSSRFPGKPLVNILEKPMILWVAELASTAVGREHVYVATESDLIKSVVSVSGIVRSVTHLVLNSVKEMPPSLPE